MNVVELFAGVGGFRVGLEAASNKFETIWANQWEPGKKNQWAYDCYIKHFGENSCVNDDIAKVKNNIPDHDFLVGGFPCQDYSVASTGAKGIEGKKGVLWWEIKDIIENKKPKYILLENVDRLIKSPSIQRGRDFGIMLKGLNDLGYIVEWKVVNAADYGYAQRRRRIFIFAYNIKTSLYNEVIKAKSPIDIIIKQGFYSDVFPAYIVDSKKTTSVDFNKFSGLVEISNEFSANFYNSGVCFNGNCFSIELMPNKEQPISLNKIIQKDVFDNKLFLSSESISKFATLRSAKKISRKKPNGDAYFYSEGSMSPYDDLDLPARTMLTSEGSINRSTHIIKDLKTGNLRLLSPVECERINGFPDNWTNTGMPTTTRYFCMGNALVVPVITRIGLKINRISESDK